jgi:hypothetical protein
MITVVIVAGCAVLAVGLIWLALRLFDGSREPPRHAATGWTPAELRGLRGPEVHHEEYATVPAFLSSPPPWPPAVARPYGQGGDQAPAAGMVAGEIPAQPDRGHETPAAGDLVTHADTALWEGHAALIPARGAPEDGLPPMSGMLRQALRDAEDAARWPDLQPGYGYADDTGEFARIMAEVAP